MALENPSVQVNVEGCTLSNKSPCHYCSRQALYHITYGKCCAILHLFRITASMIAGSVRGSLEDSINPIGICLQSGPYYGRPILMPVSQSRGDYFLQSVKMSVQPTHFIWSISFYAAPLIWWSFFKSPLALAKSSSNHQRKSVSSFLRAYLLCKESPYW